MLARLLIGSNRTFMELKSDYKAAVPLAGLF